MLRIINAKINHFSNAIEDGTRRCLAMRPIQVPYEMETFQPGQIAQLHLKDNQIVATKPQNDNGPFVVIDDMKDKIPNTDLYEDTTARSGKVTVWPGPIYLETDLIVDVEGAFKPGRLIYTRQNGYIWSCPGVPDPNRVGYSAIGKCIQAKENTIVFRLNNYLQDIQDLFEMARKQSHTEKLGIKFQTGDTIYEQ